MNRFIAADIAMIVYTLVWGLEFFSGSVSEEMNLLLFIALLMEILLNIIPYYIEKINRNIAHTVQGALVCIVAIIIICLLGGPENDATVIIGALIAATVFFMIKTFIKLFPKRKELGKNDNTSRENQSDSERDP